MTDYKNISHPDKPSDNSVIQNSTSKILQLVVSNPEPLQNQKPSSESINETREFWVEIHPLQHSRYLLMAHDSFHHLRTECVLDFHIYDEDFEPMSLVCHFPNILDKEFSEFIEDDETLYAMILIQFQMKILYELLVFCKNSNALNLIIHVQDSPDGHTLGIYESLTSYEAKIPTITGMNTQMVIPISQETFDIFDGLMNEINHQFWQTLWQDQSRNPTIRAYLKRIAA